MVHTQEKSWTTEERFSPAPYVRMGKNNEEWGHGRVESGNVASLPTRCEDEESASGVGTWAKTASPATPTTS